MEGENEEITIRVAESPKILRQDDDSVSVRLMFGDEKRDWFMLNLKIPKNKLQRI